MRVAIRKPTDVAHDATLATLATLSTHLEEDVVDIGRFGGLAVGWAGQLAVSLLCSRPYGVLSAGRRGLHERFEQYTGATTDIEYLMSATHVGRWNRTYRSHFLLAQNVQSPAPTLHPQPGYQRDPRDKEILSMPDPGEGVHTLV